MLVVDESYNCRILVLTCEFVSFGLSVDLFIIWATVGSFALSTVSVTVVPLLTVVPCLPMPGASCRVPESLVHTAIFRWHSAQKGVTIASL